MELLERAPFLAKLDGLLSEAAAGQGRLVFLGGEAGVGKSALVQHLCRLAQTRARVLLGACDSLSTPRPLGPLADIAAALGGRLERLLADGGRRDEVFRVFLDRLGEAEKSTLAVFEDVHWADEATLDLLRFLGRRLEPAHALLVATYRDDEIGPTHPLRMVMGDLATAPALYRLALPRLSEAAVRSLAEGSGLDPQELHRKTGGNPFFVTEVLAAGSEGIPLSVRDAVLARAARLSPDGRAALEACAVIGARVEPWLLEAITGLEAEAAEACISQGMLRAQDGVYTFRHELAREAVLESLSPQRRRTLHRSILKALRHAGSRDLSRLAHHAEGAEDRQAVLEYAPAAGRQAVEVRAHREAVKQYARALRFADELPPAERGPLLEAFANECAVTDRLDEAISARQKAVTIWRSLGEGLREGTNLSELASHYLRAGQNAAAEASSLAALRLLEARPPGPELARAYLMQGALRMLDRDNTEAVAWADKALTLLTDVPDSEILAISYNVLGTAQLMDGNDEAGLANLLKGVELARAAGDSRLAATLLVNLGTGSGELHKFERAERYLTDAIALAKEHDLDTVRLYATAWLALTMHYQGRWDEAAATAAVVMRRPGASAISRIMALVALGRVRARRGDPEVWVALDKALELADQTGTLQRLAPVRAARAEAAFLAGDRDRARAEANAAYGLARDHRHPWFVGELAYWRWKVGDLDGPPEVAARPFALQMAGRAGEAAAEWQRLDCPFEAARALAESDDEQALRQAHAEFERLGARPAAAAVALRAQALGHSGLPRGPRPSTRANPAQLTRRQLDILRLMADGLSNAEIAARLYRSPKTVDHHVSAVLAKLEVRSRTEAVREAMRRGIVEQNRESENPN